MSRICHYSLIILKNIVAQRIKLPVLTNKLSIFFFFTKYWLYICSEGSKLKPQLRNWRIFHKKRMNISQKFSKFLENIKVDNASNISSRYKEITKKLNKTFRDTDSEIDNCLQVGSYGRYTGIKGISDLDMLYIMPANKWDEYKDSPSELLTEVKKALVYRYPNTKIKVDRLVVDVFFCNFTFEVQPVFEVMDGDDINYKYPDTKSGSYKITKPHQEQDEMTSFRQDHGETHRYLCKMVRSWKNNVGLCMGGLLVDTLTHRFLSNHPEYDNVGASKYDELCRDFFEFLKDEPKKEHYQALGSGQDVKVKHAFQNKAKKAYDKAVEAINEMDDKKKYDTWREIFGCQFPKAEEVISESRSADYENADHEEFIEDKYPVDIRYNLKIDCEIKRNGFRETLLHILLASGDKISRVRSLDFFIDRTDVPRPYEVKWKARNVGLEAKKRKCLRGQIINPNKNGTMRHENSDFYGPHYMECYIVKNNVVVARDRIEVPIENK